MSDSIFSPEEPTIFHTTNVFHLEMFVCHEFIQSFQVQYQSPPLFVLGYQEYIAYEASLFLGHLNGLRDYKFMLGVTGKHVD